MAMRQATCDLEIAIRFGRFALQSSADPVNQIGWKVGDVSEGLVLDLSTLAVSPPQQIGSIRLAVAGTRGDGNMDGAISIGHLELPLPYLSGYEKQH